MGSLTGMRAMMMAAGEGTRLRPLTYSYPKPMVPVLNKPVMEHALENAASHGLRDIAVNLYHRAERVQKYFGDGSAWGLNLRYSIESRLMGTAGGVKKMEKFLNGGTFLILSGDGLSEIDLTAAVEFHRRKKSFATMVLKRVSSRFEYGVTLTDASGRIKKFFEKPSWSDVFADTVNTGVYIFEPGIFRHIPKGVPYDFGKQVWPALFKARLPIYGYVSNDYWCDIGNLSEYRRGQRDALSGVMRQMKPKGHEIRPGVWVEDGSVIHPLARVTAPCVIGANVHIAAQAQVGPMTVLGDGVKIARGCIVQESVLWNRVKLEPDVRLYDLIVGNDVTISRGTVFCGGVCMAPDDIPNL